MFAAGLHKGFALLEIMLVLLIGFFMIGVGLQFYGSWSTQASIQEVNYNIATLFQAMTDYYRAQCSSTGTLGKAGTSSPVQITLTQLAPYLPGNWQAINPLTSGYVLQFNPIVPATPVTVTACVVQTKGTPCTVTSSTIPTSQAKVIIWDSQVALLLTDTTKNTAYQSILGANCVSSLNGNVVTPCAQVTGNGGTYLVFQQLPSANTDTGGRGYWLMKPYLKQLQLQYTHDKMYELIPGSLDNNSNQTRNYMCGA